MTNKELISEVAKVTGFTSKDVEKVIGTMAGVIVSEASEGKDTSVLGLGKFKVKTRFARNGRNPKTGEAVQIPEKKVPVFVPEKSFKTLLNQ